MTMIISCLFVDTEISLCSHLSRIINIYVLGRKYYSPWCSSLSEGFGFEIERSFLSVFISEITKVKQTAREKMQVISDCTDN